MSAVERPLAGKVAVITGASGGLGRALCAGFLASGCDGVVAVDLDLDVTTQATAGLDGEVVPFAADVCEPEMLDAAVTEAVRRFGRVDVMVNNAGVLAPNARLHNLSLGDWRRVLDVNLLGVVNGTNAALRVMRPRGQGCIINTASIAGTTAWSHSAPYGVSKAAVIQLTKVTALEYAPEGIRANCVCPGSFQSAMFDGVPEPAVETIAARHLLGLGTPDDLVGAFIYLASDASRWTTGAALAVDGGYSIP